MSYLTVRGLAGVGLGTAATPLFDAAGYTAEDKSNILTSDKTRCVGTLPKLALYGGATLLAPGMWKVIPGLLFVGTALWNDGCIDYATDLYHGFKPVPNAPVGMGGPAGTFLYNWIPDSVLGMSCLNADRKTVITGSACDIYLRKMDELFPLPAPPVTVGVPQNLPANPESKAQADAVIQAMIDAQAIAQKQQTDGFFSQVADGLDEYNNRTSDNPTYIAVAVALGLGVLVLLKR